MHGYSGSPGVIGKMKAALASAAAPFKVAIYSLVGYSKMLEGVYDKPTMISPKNGAARYLDYPKLKDDMKNMSMSKVRSKKRVPSSIFESLTHLRNLVWYGTRSSPLHFFRQMKKRLKLAFD